MIPRYLYSVLVLLKKNYATPHAPARVVELAVITGATDGTDGIGKEYALQPYVWAPYQLLANDPLVHDDFAGRLIASQARRGGKGDRGQEQGRLAECRRWQLT